MVHVDAGIPDAGADKTGQGNVKDFSIVRDIAQADHLPADLTELMKLSPVPVRFAEDGAAVPQPDGEISVPKPSADNAGHGSREIRTQCEEIVVAVKKLEGAVLDPLFPPPVHFDELDSGGNDFPVPRLREDACKSIFNPPPAIRLFKQEIAKTGRQADDVSFHEHS
jgi:hypothetical protein